MADFNNTPIIEINATVSSLFRIPHSVRFWIYLWFNFFSLICTLFTLYFLLFDSALRRALNNHIIIVLLFLGLLYELTNIPWHLRNDQFSISWSVSPFFNLFWTFVDYPLYSLQITLFSWATVERHILIFHNQWVSTRKKCFFVHYVPIVFLSIYYLIYYSFGYFGKPCSTSFNSFLSGGIYIPCAFDRTFMLSWELIVHQVLPTGIIVISSVGLLARVLVQKSKMLQNIQWRKNRKMIIQLLSISTIYIVFNIPWVIIIFAYAYGLAESVAWAGIIYSKFLVYFIIFLFPFVTCFSLPELRAKFRQTILCRYGTRRRIDVTTNLASTDIQRRAGPSHNPTL